MAGAASPSSAISNMVSTAIRAINNEVRHPETQNSHPDVLYRRTVSAFRPQSAQSQGRGRGRGHHRTHIRLEIFLLGMPMTVVPSKQEQRELCQRGLGSPMRSSSFKKNWTLEEVQDHILSLYPGIPLDVLGYTFGKSSKSRRLNRVEFQSVVSLKRQVQKGKLFIIPKAVIQPSQSVDTRIDVRNLEQSQAEPTVVQQTSQENNSSTESEVQQTSQENNSNTESEVHQTCQENNSNTESEVALPVLTTPSRHRREAALVARCQIREWCDRREREADQSTGEASENQVNGSEELSDSILSTGTPTIQFRRTRPSLSLNRHTTGSQQSVEHESSFVSGRQEDYLEILDSEDEELQQAVEASLRDSELSNVPASQEPSLEEVLSSLSQKQLMDKLAGQV